MIVEANGKIIRLEVNDTVSRMIELTCTECGHELKDHSYTYNFGTLEEWFTSQCIACGLTENNKKFVCPQFRHGNGTF